MISTVEVEGEVVQGMGLGTQSDDLADIEAGLLQKKGRTKAESVQEALMDLPTETIEAEKVQRRQLPVVLAAQRGICAMEDRQGIQEGLEETMVNTGNVTHVTGLSGETNEIGGMVEEVGGREVEVEMKCRATGISQTARDRGDELLQSVCNIKLASKGVGGWICIVWERHLQGVLGATMNSRREICLSIPFFDVFIDSSNRVFM